MNDPREPSYYEIALTSRQAFTAFVLLLVCVVSSFFAGLWVGYGAGTGDSSVVTGEQALRTDEGAARLEEVKFFGEKDEARGSGEEPAKTGDRKAEKKKEPAAKPTLLDQLAGGRGTSSPAARSGDRTRQDAKRRPRDRPAAGAGEAAKATEKLPIEEPAQSAAKSEPAPAPAKAVTSTAQPLPSGDQMIIQVFSSADQGQAGRVFERLRADGYSAYVEPIQEKGRALYRVRIGPFASKEAAQPVAAEVQRKHRLDTWITRAGG